MKKKFTWSWIEDDCYAYYGKEELGFIEFYKPWKKWVWNQSDGIIMSFSCISHVREKLRQLESDCILPRGEVRSKGGSRHQTGGKA